MATQPPSRRSGVPGQITIHCGACSTAALVPEAATFFICRSCDSVNNIFKCAHCQSVSIAAVPGHASPAAWGCMVCGQSTQLPRFGRMPTQTAAELIANEELRASTAPAAPGSAAQAAGGYVPPVAPGSAAPGPPSGASLGGFLVLASSRPSLAVAAGCTVTATDGGVDVRSTDGHNGLQFAYGDLTVFEISGRTAPRRGRDGGRGRLGLGAADRAAEPETVLRLATATENAVLRHPTFSRAELSAAFGHAITMWRSGAAVKPEPEPLSFDQAVADFERLIVGHERGQVPEAQFVVQRAALLRRIMARGGDRRRVPHQYGAIPD